MKAKGFFGKIFSSYLLLHFLAMAVVVVLLGAGVKYGLEYYTHHGEGIVVPDLKGMTYSKAYMVLQDEGLILMVSDSGYNKTLPPDYVLAQTPGRGMKVKRGHVIYVTVNSPSSPTFTIPDIVDNSSLREAEAKLMAIGFKLLPPKMVSGEKDWVYGILSRGRRVSTGDMVSIETPLTLVIGRGMYGEEDELMDEDDILYDEEDDDVDDFLEIPDMPTDE